MRGTVTLARRLRLLRRVPSSTPGSSWARLKTRFVQFTTVSCRQSTFTDHVNKQTQLPADYIDLEKKVDALKQAHQKMLNVTYVSKAAALFPVTAIN